MRSPMSRVREWKSWAAAAGLLLLPSLAWPAHDLAAGTIAGPALVARDGVYPDGANALSMSTTVCNAGTENVAFEAPMEEAHPVVVMQVYRQSGDRFEQIGISDARHEYFALSNQFCSTCSSSSPGTYLSPGCSTDSGTGINSSQALLGPRDEIDPYLGTWDCFESHFAGGLPSCLSAHDPADHAPLDHRLVVEDVDLATPNAQYFYEAYWITENDVDIENNLGSREFSATWTGSTWGLASDPAPLLTGPALQRWGGTQNWATIPGDGRLLVASQATDAGGGLYEYEYAVFNLNSAREVGAVTIPFGDATLSNIGFHDPDADSGNDWTATQTAGEIRWETLPESADPDAPALSYGLLYNFRFTANAPPSGGALTLEAWKLAGDDTVLVDAIVPSPSASAPKPSVEALSLRAAPLPMSDQTELAFQLPEDALVSVQIFDAAGRQVRTLQAGLMQAGPVSMVWDGRADSGREVRPGVYYARLRQGSEVVSVQIPVVR